MMKHVHHFTAQTNKAIVQFGPLKDLISVTIEFLKLCQDIRNASVCLGIMLKNNENSAE